MQGLVNLNFLQEKKEADFRYGLVRIRENAESIAFYGGEENEMQLILQRFRSAVENLTVSILICWVCQHLQASHGVIISMTIVIFLVHYYLCVRMKSISISMVLSLLKFRVTCIGITLVLNILFQVISISQVSFLFAPVA